MPSDGKLGRSDILQSYSSVGGELQALEVLARALLSRIGSLSGAKDKAKAFNLAHEVEKFEAELIMSAVRATGGRQRRAANLLGMNVTTLNRKMRRYGITTEPEPQPVIDLEAEGSVSG